MKKENKSLFIYTSLIFIVSILMILIAFAGQNNINSMQPETDSSGTSLTDRVNDLSKQNSTLINEKDTLIKERDTLYHENEKNLEKIKILETDQANLNNQIRNLQEQITNYDKFTQINNLLKEKKISEAKTIYDTINVLSLNETQKIEYDKLTLEFNN